MSVPIINKQVSPLATKALRHTIIDLTKSHHSSLIILSQTFQLSPILYVNGIKRQVIMWHKQ